jgi:hypothetical protein
VDTYNTISEADSYYNHDSNNSHDSNDSHGSNDSHDSHSQPSRIRIRISILLIYFIYFKQEQE